MQSETTSTAAVPNWRGIHHIALATPDLDATRHFYADVLQMPISDVFDSKEGRGKHCFVFVKQGDDLMWGLHYFERPVTTGGTLLHLCFALPNKASADAVQDRLRSNSVATTVIPELGGNFTFYDNNGMMLEITWPKA